MPRERDGEVNASTFVLKNASYKKNAIKFIFCVHFYADRSEITKKDGNDQICFLTN